ncbi:hypothetical protein ESOMN_v1c05780 [Williamsoniiplasma somnilux]|uniref:Lipoprotein n=1 Tax=Williamsoniiplasma somnilux TaxID=215578 RepID=A0A2K8NYR6_9MOLU|nr:lipoprotein [Williamsoniiplasma somnilux]ATZ18960.1 hypothetical protein ESOMN_v1c05780 [Williamsoniiplasma somnilux]
MKKLLSIMGSLGLVASSGFTVLACTDDVKNIEEESRSIWNEIQTLIEQKTEVENDLNRVNEKIEELSKNNNQKVTKNIENINELDLDQLKAIKIELENEKAKIDEKLEIAKEEYTELSGRKVEYNGFEVPYGKESIEIMIQKNMWLDLNVPSDQIKAITIDDLKYGVWTMLSHNETDFDIEFNEVKDLITFNNENEILEELNKAAKNIMEEKGDVTIPSTHEEAGQKLKGEKIKVEGAQLILAEGVHTIRDERQNLESENEVPEDQIGTNTTYEVGTYDFSEFTLWHLIQAQK